LRLQWEKENKQKEVKGGLVIVNVGKGVAVDLVFSCPEIGSINFLKVPAIGTGSQNQTKSFVPENVDQEILLNPEDHKYSIEVFYKDIEDRKYHALFKTDLGYNDEFVIEKQEEDR
jgi:hypothetical protein